MSAPQKNTRSPNVSRCCHKGALGPIHPLLSLGAACRVLIRSIIHYGLVIASLFAPASSLASPPIEAITLDFPYVGHYYDDVSFKDGDLIGGTRIGLHLSPTWGVELHDLMKNTRRNRQAPEHDGHLVRLEGQHYFVHGRWVPFVALGGGMITLDPPDGDGLTPILNYGGGVKYFFWTSKETMEDWHFNTMALRFDLRLLHILSTDSYTDFEYTLGLHYVFRGGKKMEAPPPLPIAQETVKETVKEEVTLPPPVQEGVVVPPPQHAPMAPPEWLPRVIYFDYDKATLTREGGGTVEEIARWLSANPTIKVWLSGHTDRRGMKLYNMPLRERRVQRVVSALVALGIARNRIALFPTEEGQPVCFDESPSCDAANRRVEWGIVP